jgi:hypothetical protein
MPFALVSANSTVASLNWMTAPGIEARRIAPLWRLLADIADEDWHEVVEMDSAQVVAAQYCPDWWSASTRLLIRRVRLDSAQGMGTVGVLAGGPLAASQVRGVDVAVGPSVTLIGQRDQPAGRPRVGGRITHSG